MKNLMIVAMSLLTVTSAFAGQPNMIDCKSTDGKTQIHFTTSSVVGIPTFTLNRDNKNLLDLTQNNVSFRQEQTVMGSINTVELDRKMLADAPTSFYSVIIPGIELGNASSINFKTLLIEGYTGGFRAPTVAYQVITQTKTLQCVGSLVNF